MILPIDDNYRIAGDKQSWSIQQPRNRRDKKTGESETVWESYRWFTSLEATVNYLGEMLVRTSDAQTLAEGISGNRSGHYHALPCLIPRVSGYSGDRERRCGMKDKKKPVEAATEPRASRINHQPLKHNHSTPTLQCPQCGLTGPRGMFEPGWVIRLLELVARYPGLGIEPDLPLMSWVDKYGVYLLLSRKEMTGGKEQH